MSGHSKFANIKHKKEKNDAKKGKIFTVIGRELVMAVKAGGPDPNNNSKLRDVIAKAGLGFSLVPDIPGQRDPGLSYIPMENIPPLQFGLYYKNLSTHPALKRFIELMQEEFK